MNWRRTEKENDLRQPRDQFEFAASKATTTLLRPFLAVLRYSSVLLARPDMAATAPGTPFKGSQKGGLTSGVLGVAGVGSGAGIDGRMRRLANEYTHMRRNAGVLKKAYLTEKSKADDLAQEAQAKDHFWREKVEENDVVYKVPCATREDLAMLACAAPF